jgi:hypothetical protein
VAQALAQVLEADVRSIRVLPNVTPFPAGLAHLRRDDPMSLAAEVSYGALVEVGRLDLANLVQWFENDDGSLYLEPMDELSPDDLALMLRAEALALSAISRSDREPHPPRASDGVPPRPANPSASAVAGAGGTVPTSSYAHRESTMRIAQQKEGTPQ